MLHDKIAKIGYCRCKLPMFKTRVGIRDKIRYIIIYHTYTSVSFN